MVSNKRVQSEVAYLSGETVNRFSLWWGYMRREKTILYSRRVSGHPEKTSFSNYEIVSDWLNELGETLPSVAPRFRSRNSKRPLQRPFFATSRPLRKSFIDIFFSKARTNARSVISANRCPSIILEFFWCSCAYHRGEISPTLHLFPQSLPAIGNINSVKTSTKGTTMEKHPSHLSHSGRGQHKYITS